MSTRHARLAAALCSVFALASTNVATAQAAPTFVYVDATAAYPKLYFSAGARQTNNVRLIGASDGVQITDDYRVVPGTGCTQVPDTPNSVRCRFAFAGAKLLFDLGDGDDVLASPLGHRLEVTAGDGDDWIWSGSGNDSLDGGMGNDHLWGYDGNDDLIGGPGPVDGEPSGDDDSLAGGAGTDTARYTSYAGPVQVSIDNEANDGLSRGPTFWGDFVLLERDNVKVDVENITGSPYGDRLRGNAAANTLSGGLGTDQIWGGDGKDTLYGGRDDDELWGEFGDDVLDSRDYRGPILGIDGVVDCGPGNDHALHDYDDAVKFATCEKRTST